MTLKVGDWVTLIDTSRKPYGSIVLYVKNDVAFFHYDGWSHKWDEWIHMDSPRILPYDEQAHKDRLATCRIQEKFNLERHKVYLAEQKIRKKEELEKQKIRIAQERIKNYHKTITNHTFLKQPIDHKMYDKHVKYITKRVMGYGRRRSSSSFEMDTNTLILHGYIKYSDITPDININLLKEYVENNIISTTTCLEKAINDFSEHPDKLKVIIKYSHVVPSIQCLINYMTRHKKNFMYKILNVMISSDRHIKINNLPKNKKIIKRITAYLIKYHKEPNHKMTLPELLIKYNPQFDIDFIKFYTQFFRNTHPNFLLIVDKIILNKVMNLVNTPTPIQQIPSSHRIIKLGQRKSYKRLINKRDELSVNASCIKLFGIKPTQSSPLHIRTLLRSYIVSHDLYDETTSLIRLDDTLCETFNITKNRYIRMTNFINLVSKCF